MLRAIVTGLVLCALIASVPARAADLAPSVIIFDSSGSMAAAEKDRRTKLDVARSIVADTLRKWPSTSQIAVTAYGHRRKADCSDIETILPMAPISAPAIGKRLAKLKALGKTPISASLQQAATLLSKEGGNIVLISDGIETCSTDPCAVASTLRAANAKVVIHVVGFGIERSAVAQLKCIAEAGGGTFFDASNASELADALTRVAEKAAEPPPSPPLVTEPTPAPPPSTKPPSAAEAKPPPPSPQPDPPKIVRTSLTAIAKIADDIIEAPARWTVADSNGQVVYEGESRALSLDLKEGRYTVTAAAANASGTAEIVVSAEPREFKVELDAGRLDLSVAPDASAEPYSDLDVADIEWTMAPKSGQREIKLPQTASPSLLVAPGEYDITVSSKGLSAKASVKVVTGTATPAKIDFALGTLVLEAANDHVEPPISDAGVMMWRVGTEPNTQEIKGQARPRLVLPEGDYPVTLTFTGALFEAKAQIKAGDERVVRVIVGGGELSLSAQLGQSTPALSDWRDATWTVAPSGSDATTGQPLTLQEATPTVPLAPGRWRIVVASGSVIKEQEVIVGAGRKTPAAFVLDAARLTMMITVNTTNGAEPSNTVYEVFARNQDGSTADTPLFSTGSSTNAMTILPAGKWLVRTSDNEGRSGEADVELKAGEERELNIPMR